MIIIFDTLVLLIAALHLYILVLEMFLWQRPAGRRAFATTAEFAASTRVLAANQGLYNGFLAAGLAGDTGVKTRRCSCFSSAACWWPAFSAG